MGDNTQPLAERNQKRHNQKLRRSGPAIIKNSANARALFSSSRWSGNGATAPGKPAYCQWAPANGTKTHYVQGPWSGYTAIKIRLATESHFTRAPE